MTNLTTPKTNRLRQAIDSKDVLLGAMVNTPSTQFVEICGLLGFDWLFVDGEHEYVDVRLAYELCTAADAVGVPLMVRVPANRDDILLSFAEAGAHAIVTPGISTVEEAEALVEALSYPPRGRRGLHSRTRASGYGIGIDPPKYFGCTDAHVIPVAMIESVSAIANIDAIVGVRDLDFFLVGPGDLSGSLGLPGRIRDPLVTETVNRTIQKLIDARKTVAILASTPEDTSEYVRRGVRMPMCSTGAIVGNSLKSFLAETRDRILGE